LCYAFHLREKSRYENGFRVSLKINGLLVYDDVRHDWQGEIMDQRAAGL
jgi:hypothetical protein